MPVEIVLEDDRWRALAFESLCIRAVEMTLTTLSLSPTSFTVEILACDDYRIAELNYKFRDKSTSTNVLSWPSVDRCAAKDGERPQPPNEEQEPDLGNIAFAYETCASEAHQAGKPLTEHLLHLVVHATLHLLGYDHQRDQDATLMERIELTVLGKLGVDNPYLT